MSDGCLDCLMTTYFSRELVVLMVVGVVVVVSAECEVMQ